MLEYEYKGIRVREGTFDGVRMFEATVRCLPDVAEYADTYEEAYDLIADTIDSTLMLDSSYNKDRYLIKEWRSLEHTNDKLPNRKHLFNPTSLYHFKYSDGGIDTVSQRRIKND